jgi:hypothetical protein
MESHMVPGGTKHSGNERRETHAGKSAPFLAGILPSE